VTQKPRLLVHTSRQAIRWGDMDMLGHVNNTVYFRYLEQARIEWIYGLHPDGETYSGTGPVVVNASCTFLTPLVYPGDIEVRMYLGDPGRTSVASFYEIWMNGRKYADGAAKIVWIDLATGRSVPLPDAVVALLCAHGQTQVAAACRTPDNPAQNRGTRT
jgi:acyl-CoA thioester hydrolase